MRILWVNDLAASRGGCEAYVQSTARLLDERGVESFLCYDPGHEADPAFLRTFAGTFPRVDIAAQVEDLQPDLIYVHRCEDRQAVESLASTDRPVLRFFHDHRLFCLREHKYTGWSHKTCTRRTGLGCYACPGFVVRRGDRRFGLRTLGRLEDEQRVNSRLTGWVVGSRYMAGHLEDHGFDPARVHTIPLYAPVPDEGAGAAPSFPEGAAPPEARRETDLLVFAGQLIRGKGLDILLKALARSRGSLRLVVAGQGPQEGEYRALAESLGIAHHVAFVGWKGAGELAELYRRCLAAVVPSRAPETFGLTGLEAMSHGAPVIAARVGGMGEWHREGITGLGFDSGDSGGLAEAMDTLASDPDRARSMGEAGRSLHRERFLPEHHADRLMALFHSVARAPARAERIAS